MASKEIAAQPSFDSKNNPNNVALSMNKANKSQTSQALIIQTYSNSVLQQPAVDFSGNPRLLPYETSINNGLARAKLHVNAYTDTILPAIIDNMSHIRNYYALHNAVATTLPEGSTEEEWIIALNALKSTSLEYQVKARNTVTMLNNLHGKLVHDASTFKTAVSDFNSAVEGDNGVLDSINDKLSSIQENIDAAIAGVVFSTLAIVGAIFMICVGSIADFVTAGTTTPLVVGGIGILVGGATGEVAASIKLAGFNSAKAALLTREANLKEEVKLATGIQTSYTSLRNKARNAVIASKEMENTWQSLSDDLETLIGELKSGMTNAGQVERYKQ